MIDLDLFFYNFGGQTAFSICFDEFKFYEYIYNRLVESEYTEKEDKSTEEVMKECKFKERLIRILQMPTRSFAVQVKEALDKQVQAKKLDSD